MGKPFSTEFLVLLQKSRSLVAASKQRVVLSWLLATDAHLARLQGLQGREGDTETLGSHGWSTRLQVLVPAQEQTKEKKVLVAQIGVLASK